MQLDPIREARQMQAIRLWGKQKCRGTLEAVTGFGKTITALLAARLLLEKYPKPRNPRWTSTILVVVPTDHLKKKWQSDLESWGFKDYRVLIVNNLAKLLEYRCRLLILDEVHMYTGEVFKAAFETPEYQCLLALTATLPEDREKAYYIEQFAPVFDTVTMQECLENGWTADYRVINWGLELDEEERLLYNKHSANVSKGLGFFGGDFNLLTNATREPALMARLASDLGQTPGFLLGAATRALKGARDRAKILSESPVKVEAAMQIARALPEKKILTFSQVTGVVDLLTDIMQDEGQKALAYHAALSGRKIDGKYYSKAKIRDYALDAFREGSINRLNAAKALDMGMDIPDIDLSIILSGNSKQLQGIQRLGRIIRKNGNKIAIEINLYILDSQDRKWLISRQKQISAKQIRWVSSIEEVLECIPSIV